MIERYIAIHEAGHVIAGFSTGIGVDYVCMDPSEDSLAYVKYKRTESDHPGVLMIYTRCRLLMIASGPVAEAIHHGVESIDFDMIDINEDEIESYHKALSEYADMASSGIEDPNERDDFIIEIFEDVWHDIVNTIRENWSIIEKIADRLQQGGIIPGTELKAIYDNEVMF